MVMLDILFEDVGNKLKRLAKGIFVIEAIAAILAGFMILLSDIELILLALLTMICGPLVALISSWFLYGFGELIDKTSWIERNTGASLLHTTPAQPPAVTVAPAVSNNMYAAVSSAPSVYAPANNTPNVPTSQSTSVFQEPAVKRNTMDGDTYIPGRTYTNGEQVKFQGVWYECTAKGSGSVWNPKQNPAQWKELSPTATATPMQQ